MIRRGVRSPATYQQLGRKIRRRIFWTFVAFGFGAAATWWYREDVFLWLIEPAKGSLSPFPGGLPVFTSPTEMFSTTIRLAIHGGVITALPVLAFGLYTLFKPVLSPQQRRAIVTFASLSLLLFLLGGAFVYYVMLPVGLDFLLNFGGGVAVPLITLDRYLELLTQLMLAIGLVFEIPLAMFLLSKLRIIPYKRFRTMRKFVPFAALILSAIITPTIDILNQMLVALPIVALYEVGLLLAWLAHPEDDDYLKVKVCRDAVLWVWYLPVRTYRKVVSLAKRLWRSVPPG